MKKPWGTRRLRDIKSASFNSLQENFQYHFIKPDANQEIAKNQEWICLRRCINTNVQNKRRSTKLKIDLICFGKRRVNIFSHSVDDFHSHRFVSPPACYNIPTNLRKVWIKKAIVIEFKENFNGKIWFTKSYWPRHSK